MKKLTLSILTCLILLSPNLVLSETLSDLVEREGLYYKKFSDVPFTGKITGKTRGAFKNGKEDGDWVSYYNNGQLRYKGSYKNGKYEGFWVSYFRENGQLYLKGNYKNDKEEGAWVGYKKDGTVWEAFTGTFKDGKKIK
jgi:hypothetical protein